MKIQKWNETEKYQRQSEILKQALGTPEHSLDEVLRLMRARGESTVYLAGKRLDNDFCFGSGEVGMLLFVLPEAAAKAGVPGYHPGSTELYATFQGSLVLQCLEDGVVRERTLDATHPFLLPPGQCHRVRQSPPATAATLIVKTNLAHEPGVIRCENCTYYADPAACPLHQTWRRDAV